jgi:hypothetical protein
MDKLGAENWSLLCMAVGNNESHRSGAAARSAAECGEREDSAGPGQTLPSYSHSIRTHPQWPLIDSRITFPF